MSTTAYKIEVMQWHEDGGPVEFRRSGCLAFAWMTASKPKWDWMHNDYRKKPKPIECWVRVLDGSVASTIHMSKEDADAVYDSQSDIKDRWSVRKVVIE